MRIENFKPSNNFQSFGLIFNEMRSLKQIVALFGRNGSGKSRLLRYLPSEIDRVKQEVSTLKDRIIYYENLKKQKTLDKAEENELNQSVTELNIILADINLEEKENQIIVINQRSANPDKQQNMQDNDYRSGSIDLITNPEYHTVKKNCVKFIKALCRADISIDYHTKNKGKKFYGAHDIIVNRNLEIFRLIKEVVKKIMNKELDYFTDEHLTPIVTLDEREIDVGELSDGEKELLAFSVFLVLQSQDKNLEASDPLKVISTHTLENKIVLIDEPDLFLHPKAQIDLINGLRDLVGDNGQIWIATHSIALLSALNRDEIWLMEQGDITSPSIETPNKVLNSLVGEENIDSLENFISSQYEWAAIQFALECLFPPAVVDYKKQDPQQKQIIAQLSIPDKPLRILDFGAGKGRVAREILRNKKLASKLYYQPLENNEEFKEQLNELTLKLQTLSKEDNTKEREVINDYEKLNEKQYQEFFDIVLLVNVLHELPVNKWQVILNAILNSLKPDGILLILEDQAIPYGENAQEYGFVILDEQEFKLLFSLENTPKNIQHIDPKYSDRLTCIKIPKSKSKVDNDSIYEALKRKKINCKVSINKLRNKENKGPKDGRKNSFLTQLYANVDMANSDMKLNTKIETVEEKV